MDAGEPDDERPDVFRETSDGTIALLPSTSRRQGWVLLVDGDSQSYVDLADPGYLHLAYARGMAAIADTVLTGRVDGSSETVIVHVGGALMALPRCMAQRWPGTTHLVAEPNETLLELIDTHVPLAADAPIEVRPVLGEELVAGLDEGSAEAVVLDAFVNGSTVPSSLRTAAFVADVARVLAPGGSFVANLIDWTGLPVSNPLAELTERAIGTTRRFASRGLLDGTDDGGTVLLVATARDDVDDETLARAVADAGPFAPVPR